MPRISTFAINHHIMTHNRQTTEHKHQSRSHTTQTRPGTTWKVVELATPVSEEARQKRQIAEEQYREMVKQQQEEEARRREQAKKIEEDRVAIYDGHIDLINAATDPEHPLSSCELRDRIYHLGVLTKPSGWYLHSTKQGLPQSKGENLFKIILNRDDFDPNTRFALINYLCNLGYLEHYQFLMKNTDVENTLTFISQSMKAMSNIHDIENDCAVFKALAAKNQAFVGFQAAIVKIAQIRILEAIKENRATNITPTTETFLASTESCIRKNHSSFDIYKMLRSNKTASPTIEAIFKAKCKRAEARINGLLSQPSKKPHFQLNETPSAPEQKAALMRR